jgi:hypothetical protein
MKLTKFVALCIALSAFFSIQAGPPGGGSAETPDKTGLQASLNTGFTGLNGIASGGIIYTVPDGKRLIIENVSAMCAISPTEKVYRAYVYTNNTSGAMSHHLIPVFTGTDGNPNFGIHLINWSGRLYADAGPVQVGALKSGTLMSNYTCYYTISGYLISVP